MCGITACLSHDGSLQPLLTGLRRLEYRGYDSAGIALQNGHGINLVKRAGEVDNLTREVRKHELNGTVGIGHTRWSTHGPPTDVNAHPHTNENGTVAVVHNGIIDNYASLKAALIDRGHQFRGETDTEVVPHLVEEELERGYETEVAFRRAVAQLEGTYALAMMVDGEHTIYATRSGSPLVFGEGDDKWFIASDVPAFVEYTNRVRYLHDGDFIRLSADGVTITDTDGNLVNRPLELVDWDPETVGKAGFDHYMHKEIHEQPEALRRTIQGRVNPLSGVVSFEELPPGTFAGVEQVHVVGMGTSYHAAMYAASLLCDRGVAAYPFLAGEYSHTRPPVTEETLVVAVSQSGETADTIDAIRSAQRSGARTLAVTNVVASSLTRECDDTLLIRAGPEIGVAATKTFSSQVTALLLLSELLVADITGRAHLDNQELLESVSQLPSDIQSVIETSTAANVARGYAGSDAYLFIGRGSAHPVALEGALKFKEITYCHAEGFAASELKHGPLALVTSRTPVFVTFTGEDDETTLNNAKEVQARGAPVIAITSQTEGDIVDLADHVLTIPPMHPELAGIAANVQLQLVAYHAAHLLDRSIDKPRNLAKCVTVE